MIYFVTEHINKTLTTKCGGSPHDSFASDSGTDLVVSRQDVTDGFLGLNFRSSIKGCTVSGTTTDNVVIDIYVSVATVEGSLEWSTGFCCFCYLVLSTSCQTGSTLRKIRRFC